MYPFDGNNSMMAWPWRNGIPAQWVLDGSYGLPLHAPFWVLTRDSPSVGFLFKNGDAESSHGARKPVKTSSCTDCFDKCRFYSVLFFAYSTLKILFVTDIIKLPNPQRHFFIFFMDRELIFSDIDLYFAGGLTWKFSRNKKYLLIILPKCLHRIKWYCFFVVCLCQRKQGLSNTNQDDVISTMFLAALDRVIDRNSIKVVLKYWLMWQNCMWINSLFKDSCYARIVFSNVHLLSAWKKRRKKWPGGI